MVCRDHLTLIAFDDRHQHFGRIKEIAPHLTIRDGMRPLPRTALWIAGGALVELSLAVARHVLLLEQWIQGGPTRRNGVALRVTKSLLAGIRTHQASRHHLRTTCRVFASRKAHWAQPQLSCEAINL